MGNTNKNFVLSNFKQIKRQSNTIIGTVSQVAIRNSNQNQNYLLKIFRFNDPIQYSEKSLLFNKIKSLNQTGKLNNLLNVTQIHQSHSSKLCSQAFELYLFMDYYESDLQSICLTKSMKQKSFSQNQIIKIIESVINGLITIKQNNLLTPIISKKCIVFTENDEIKIIPGDFIQMICPFQYLINGQRKNQSNFPFLPPEVFRLIQNGSFDQSIFMNQKTTIFALGMLILQLIYNNQKEEHNFYKLYNFKSFTFNSLEVDKLISNINYSVELKQLIKGMVQPNQRLRFSYFKVYQILKSKKQTENISGSKKKNLKLQRNYNTFSHRSMSKSFAPSVTLSIGNKNKFQKDILNQSMKSSIQNYHSNNINRNSSISLFTQEYLLKKNNKKFVKINLKSKPHKQKINKQKIIELGNKSRDHLFFNESNSDLTNFQFETTQIQEQQKPKKYPGIKTFLNISSVKKVQIQNKNSQKTQLSLISKKSHRINKNQNIQQMNLSLSSNYLSENKTLNNIQMKKSLFQARKDLNQSKLKITSQFNKIRGKNIDIFKIDSKSSKKNQQQKQNKNPKNKLSTMKINPFTQIQSILQNNSISAFSQRKVKFNYDMNLLKESKDDKRSNSSNRYFSKKVFPNGARYQGQVQKILNQEKHQIQFQEGQQIFNGNGILYYPNDEICYKGQWINNKFNGYGVLYNENYFFDEKLPSINYENFNKNVFIDWMVYEGEFENDMKNGYGVLKFRNGQKYEGRFIKDCIQGVGVFFTKENKLIRGYWKNGNLIKQN